MEMRAEFGTHLERIKEYVCMQVPSLALKSLLALAPSAFLMAPPGGRDHLVAARFALACKYICMSVCM